MKKVYNSLEEFSEEVGCFMQPEKVKPTTQWLLYQIIEPNHTRYIGEVHKCYEGDELTKVIDSYGYNVVAVNIGEQEVNTLEEEFKMEQYIREYKHLLGCVYVGNWFDDIDEYTVVWQVTEGKLIDFDIKFKPMLFITHEDQLVTYKEYMQMYYPEYKHVWSEQL